MVIGPDGWGPGVLGDLVDVVDGCLDDEEAEILLLGLPEDLRGVGYDGMVPNFPVAIDVGEETLAFDSDLIGQHYVELCRVQVLVASVFAVLDQGHPRYRRILVATFSNLLRLLAGVVSVVVGEEGLDVGGAEGDFDPVGIDQRTGLGLGVVEARRCPTVTKSFPVLCGFPSELTDFFFQRVIVSAGEEVVFFCGGESFDGLRTHASCFFTAGGDEVKPLRIRRVPPEVYGSLVVFPVIAGPVLSLVPDLSEEGKVVEVSFHGCSQQIDLLDHGECVRLHRRGFGRFTGDRLAAAAENSD